MIKKVKKTYSKNSQIISGILVLENKRVFKGIGIGYQGEATGEVCFNTSITGYQEIISDPSYAGQIINFTFPHVGNVGTNNEDYESDKIWTKGVVFNSEITSPSNYRSFQHSYAEAPSRDDDNTQQPPSSPDPDNTRHHASRCRTCIGRIHNYFISIKC